jgi:hypothetical protein
MSGQQAPLDFTPFVAEIFSDLYDELEARFPELVALPERDRRAIATAITKAAWRGVLRGVALSTHEINQRAPQVRIQTWFDTDGEEPDPWAERHGEEMLMEQQSDLPRKIAETMIVDQNDTPLAVIAGAYLWPPLGAVVELGDPNRDAVVREVRLQLHPDEATVMVRVEDTGELLSREDA